ncbi:asparagine synthetase [Marinomonas sp. SBI22]|uniref:asparagine synthetase B family protein n=1 Tax=unclassified Marinomonas TaxID=196814 RepID=UPI0007AFCE45|nr:MULTISPECIES: asparagine synthase-related protein [unclassified Marinomonas]KZM44892.1 asparagine synthetase [Marinomonas sp. SBI22]KZM46591.1 asparagine synthetase [Marinomonas sp. SBI8L]
MCGLFVSNNPSVNASSLSTISACLKFRGPDSSSGLVFHHKWSLYHSRLSIIDVSEQENQPVFDNMGGVLVFNGEILNYKELGLKYFNKEYFSDSKLLSDLLASKKLNVNELDGFFAFVYIDELGAVKKICRDRFGVKPLFYYEDSGYITIASEPRVFKELFNTKVNENAISEYYATRSPIFSGSFFEGVNSVIPGSCLISGTYFDCQDFILESYKNNSEKELEDIIVKSISSRLVADTPVGLLLSRGIDSNLLKELGSFDSFYSIGFPGDADIEYLKSKEIDNLTIVECNNEQYLESFNYLLKLRGEPMSVPNEVLLYRLAKVASKDGVKVLLSGEGADEFFGGYDRIFNWAANTEHFNLDDFLSLYCYIPPDKNSKLYQKFFNLFDLVKFKTTFEIVRWFFIRYHMPILFRRLDFSLMAAGVEGREPLANHHIFEIAINYCKDELMCKNLGKAPLRQLLMKYLGKDFAYESKVGFPVDLRKVFTNSDNKTSYDLWFQENLKVLK